MTIDVTLLPFPAPAPNIQTQSQTEFSANADSFVSHLIDEFPKYNTFASEANALGTQINTDATTASNAASSASTSETNAATSETNAATSETNAAASAAYASQYKTDAESARDLAQGYAASVDADNIVHKPGSGLPNEAGSAAFKDVTTSNTDTTAGRLLKVGYMGLGAPSGTLGDVDLNTVTTQGKFKLQKTPGLDLDDLNYPPIGRGSNNDYYGLLLVERVEYSGEYRLCQIVISVSGVMSWRVFNQSGFRPWKTSVTNDLLKTINGQSLVGAGDFHLVKPLVYDTHAASASVFQYLTTVVTVEDSDLQGEYNLVQETAVSFEKEGTIVLDISITPYNTNYIVNGLAISLVKYDYENTTWSTVSSEFSDIHNGMISAPVDFTITISNNKPTDVYYLMITDFDDNSGTGWSADLEYSAIRRPVVTHTLPANWVNIGTGDTTKAYVPEITVREY